MDRPRSRYSPTPRTTTTYDSGRSGGYTDVETAVIDDRAGYRSDYGRPYGPRDDGRPYGQSYGNEPYGRQPNGDPDGGHDDGVQDYDDYDDIREYHDPIDRRWIWVASVAGAILLIAVICTAVILGGGDSGSVSKTVAPPITATAPATTTAPSVVAAPPTPLVPPAPLSPETVTTVAPSPTAAAVPAPTEAVPVPRSVTYQVTGTRQMIDLVTVVYTDQQGALQTEFNVALPWTRTVALDPGVQLSSVTATSLTGQLNCSITDAAGATLVAQAANSMITTCTK